MLIAIPLAVLHFSDPVMLVGLLAAGIPPALHLLNRVRSPNVRFPTLRFLKITAQKTSRRRRIQHWLLLLLRMILFALAAMTISGPLVRGGSALGAYGFVGLLLAAIALAVVALLLWQKARGRSATANTANDAAPATSERPPVSALKSWTVPLAIVLLLLAMGGAAFGLYGLTSRTFFNGRSGTFNGNSLACVLILDNSQSMLARRGSESRLVRAVRHARTLLRHSIRPAEAALLFTNPAGKPVQRAVSPDISSALDRLANVRSLGVAVPMRRLIRQASKMLAKSSEANKMVVVLSDMAAHAFDDPRVFDTLAKSNIQLVLMPEARGVAADVGITRMRVLRGHAVVGGRLVVAATLRNNGDGAIVRKAQLYFDGRPIARQRRQVDLGPYKSGQATARIRLECPLGKRGWHVVSVRLTHAADALAWDNQRSISIHVHRAVRVLVIGNHARVRAGSCAYYAEAALAPFGTRAGGSVPWAIRPVHRGVKAAAALRLRGFKTVYVCDATGVSPALVGKLKRFTRHGGTLVWMLGMRARPAGYAAAAATGLLPGNLSGPVIARRGVRVGQVDTRHPLLAHLFLTQQPFGRIIVVGRWGFSRRVPPADIRMALANYVPFLVRTRLGNGTIYTLLSAPGGDFTNLATTPIFLPMLVRMALRAVGVPRRDSATPGRPARLPVIGGVNQLVSVTSPADGPKPGVTTAVAMTKTASGQTWSYANTWLSGTYHWRAGPKTTGLFVVNNPGKEANLREADIAGLARGNPAAAKTIIAKNPAALLAVLSTRGQGISLAPGVLAVVLILAVLEAFFANRYRSVAQDDAAASPATAVAA